MTEDHKSPTPADLGLKQPVSLREPVKASVPAVVGLALVQAGGGVAGGFADAVVALRC
jgi:hypothetical protein